ncbi:hypothetical protein M8C21_018521 [Ambrosia artemisiifolia]|uniref:Gag1-like clamp domain-containing protein n=1 Tax=Ambrosia artemisiifolia TaxID=4212 RepID=A0AAD5BTE8_AMBAR|nr:hypothetical protein M8C21_018521 [Ambrosia artemisiifolia]
MMEVDASSQANGIITMEVNNRSTRSTEKCSLEVPPPRNEAKKNPETSESSTTVFINHGAIAWNEGRRRWGRMPKDPIISWSTTYEDLLSTTNKFSEPIPLSEMVDFLVYIWDSEAIDVIDLSLCSKKPFIHSKVIGAILLSCVQNVGNLRSMRR